MKKLEKKEVCLDVIERINNSKLHMQTGVYVANKEIANSLTDKPQQLQTLIGDKVCDVCAKGGLFVSCIMLRNEWTITKNRLWNIGEGVLVYYDDTIVDYLGDIFEKEELDLIECAYELHPIRNRDLDNMSYEGDVPSDFDRISAWLEYWNAEGSENFGEDVNKAVSFGCQYIEADDRMIAIMNNIIANGAFTP